MYCKSVIKKSLMKIEYYVRHQYGKIRRKFADAKIQQAWEDMRLGKTIMDDDIKFLEAIGIELVEVKEPGK